MKDEIKTEGELGDSSSSRILHPSSLRYYQLTHDYLVPSLRDYRLGANLGLNPGNFEFAVAADFDDVAGYLAYRDHPSHRAIVAEFIQPIVAERAAVQYEC